MVNVDKKTIAAGGIIATLIAAVVIMNYVTAPTQFKFIVWGDTKSGINILQTESKSIISKGLNPDFLLYTGDLCDSGPTTSCFATWKNAYNGGTNNGLFNKTFAVRGNHDSSGGSVWQSSFDFKSVVSRINATNYAEQTLDEMYSFDYKNSHFVGIDLPGGGVDTMSSSEIGWLDQDLTKAEQRGLKHAFLFWHGPIYPVDGHISDPPAALITVLNKHPIITAGFFGHEHVLTWTHVTNKTISTVTHPFEEFIIGGAGASLYSLKTGRQVDYYLNGYGYALVAVNGDNFDVSFYKSDGTLAKTLSFTGGPTPTPTPTPNPSNLTVSMTNITLTVTANGGTLPYTYNWTGFLTLPTPCSGIDTNTLTCNPTTPGTYNFTVVVNDAENNIRTISNNLTGQSRQSDSYTNTDSHTDSYTKPKSIIGYILLSVVWRKS